MTALLVGAYGADMGGGARGVSRVRRSPEGSLSLSGDAISAPSPSWVAVRGQRMVACLEGTGELAWFTRSGDEWVADGVAATGGLYPCHAAFIDDGTVVVACYGDGAVVVMRHGDADAAQRLEGTGSGPLAAQEGPHAHHVHVLPDGRVLTLDLGADRLHAHRVGGNGLLERVDSVILPEGTGPRDILELPDGRLVVLGEWSCELLVCAPRGLSFELVQVVALPGAQPGVDQAAALGLSADGAFLYAGVRGGNRIAVLAVEESGLRAFSSVSSGGEWPRHLVVDGDWLHVANQLSDAVVTFRLGADGIPVQVSTFDTPAPTCVVKTTPNLC